MDKEEYCEARIVWMCSKGVGGKEISTKNCEMFRTFGPWSKPKYCPYCGKKLKWSDEDE